jgi:hypothetical protein
MAELDAERVAYEVERLQYIEEREQKIREAQLAREVAAENRHALLMEKQIAAQEGLRFIERFCRIGTRHAGCSDQGQD